MPCLLLIILTVLLPNLALADEWTRLLDLRGNWKFEIGDDQRWSQPGFDDGSWEEIFVPSPWEDEGFPGYDGYAWYRRRFNAAPDLENKTVYLHLGNIDDVDEVYVNGHFIGFSGGFPPDYFTAYQQNRIYYVPQSFLKFSGENVIAVRVFDEQLVGGIFRGPVGLFEPRYPLNPDIPLEGLWRFTTGDDREWQEQKFDDGHWRQLIVPLQWETQGFRDYDGFAWYRREFTISKNFENQRLILLLGRIDDLDEAYLNGERIGRTGRMYSDPDRIRISGDEWLELRAYYIPSGYLNFSGTNVIAVRVYDGLLDGGIYDGPVGIVTQPRYREWFKKYGRRDRSFWDILEF